MKAAARKITKVLALLAIVGAALFAVAGAGAGTTGEPVGLDPWAVGLLQQQNDVLDPWAVNLVAHSRRQAAPIDSRDLAVDPWTVGLVQRSPQAVPLDSRDLLAASRGAEPTVIATTPSASPGFDYMDAGIGAAATLVAVLLVGVPAVMLRRHGSSEPAAL